MRDKPDTRQKGWKNKYRTIKVLGYTWGGWLADEGLHFFARGNYQDGFTEIKCRDSECFDGSLELMAREGLTR